MQHQSKDQQQQQRVRHQSASKLTNHHHDQLLGKKSNSAGAKFQTVDSLPSGASKMITDRESFNHRVKEIMVKRKQDQVWTQQRIEELHKQRQRLEEEQIRLKQAKEKCRMPSPYKVLDPIDTKGNDTNRNHIDTLGPANVESYVEKTSQQIPEMVENLEKLRSQLLKYKSEPVDLHHCVLSYQAWNLDNYFMVREIVTSLVESVVDKAHDCVELHGKESLDTRLLMDAGEKVLDYQQQFSNKEKITKLITEDLILQVTCQLIGEIAAEWIHVEQCTRYLAERIALHTAEHVTTGRLEGRNPQDPAYDMITATYHRLCRNRDHAPKQHIWNHTQRLQSTQGTMIGKSDSAISLLSQHYDVEQLDFLHVLPNDLTPRKKLLPAYRAYRDMEKEYWKHMAVSKSSLQLSKTIRGISSAAVSPNQRYIAFGSMRGDVIVYDLHHHPPFPVHAFCNRRRPEAIQHISWSTDSSRLVTVTHDGNLSVWSMQSSPVSSQKDIKELHIKSNSSVLPSTTQLRQIVQMHAGNYDFNFKKGPLSETGAQSEIALSKLSCFHPAHTLLGTQNHLMVGLGSGDILRLNLDLSVQKRQQIDTPQETEIVNCPTIKPSGGDSYLGNQSIPGELFRHHKSPVRHIGFIGNHGDMVSVDQQGHLFIWRYSKKQRTHFGWFEPKEKYILDMAERVFTPREDEPPVVHIGDLSEKGPYTKMKLAARDYAESFVERCKLDSLWHEEYDNEYGTMKQIYKPATVEETGSIFHTVIRQKEPRCLLQHYSYYCIPTTNVSTRCLSIQQTPCGQNLIVMMLYPQFWPKGPHITFIVVNLEAMQVMNTRIDVKLTPTEYKACLENDVCSFQISQPLDATNSGYIHCYILGILRIFSINTGCLVRQASVQADSKTSHMTKVTMVTVAGGLNGKVHVISYSKANSIIEFVQLQDKNSAELRRSIYKAYMLWKPKDIPQVPIEQTLRQAPWNLDSNPNHHHLELFLYLLLLQCMDAAISLSEKIPRMPHEMVAKYEGEARQRMYRKIAHRMGHNNPLDERLEGSNPGDDAT